MAGNSWAEREESNEEAVERLLVSEILHSNENLICSSFFKNFN